KEEAVLLRDDYLVDAQDGVPYEVEFNLVSVGLPGLSERTFKMAGSGTVPNHSLGETTTLLRACHDTYCARKGVSANDATVVCLVLPNERNIYDQKDILTHPNLDGHTARIPFPSLASARVEASPAGGLPDLYLEGCDTPVSTIYF
ncbi:hypothetical protein KIPB_013830, partial [Kipferlia bialata]